MKRAIALAIMLLFTAFTAGATITPAPTTENTAPCNQYTATDTLETKEPSVSITTLSGMPEMKFSYYYNSPKQSLKYKVHIKLPVNVRQSNITLPKHTRFIQTGENVTLHSNTTATLTGNEGSFIISSNKSHRVEGSNQYTLFTPKKIYANIPDIILSYDNACVNIASAETSLSMTATNGKIKHSQVTYYKIPEHASYNTVTITTNKTTVTLVKPKSLNLPNTKMSILVSQTRKLIHSHKGYPSEIIIHIVPSSMNGASGIHVPQGKNSSFIWITNTVEPNGAPNSLSHELVHTRQNYNLGSEMVWFTEASAEYLATAEDGNSDTNLDPLVLDSYAEEYNNSTQKPVLANTSTWNSATPYNKGAIVLYHLDQKLNEHGYSVSKLLLWMNDQEKVTYEKFRKKIRKETNKSVVTWLNKSVQGTYLPRTEPKMEDKPEWA